MSYNTFYYSCPVSSSYAVTYNKICIFIKYTFGLVKQHVTLPAPQPLITHTLTPYRPQSSRNFLVLQIIMNPTKSVGQGNFYTKLSQNIISDGTSIVKRLTSRSRTGHSLQIQIHHHKEFALHLIWYIKTNDKTSRCIERIFSSYRSSYMELVNIR